MKKKVSNFCQIYNRAIEKLNRTNRRVPYSTRWLYICLNFLEHRLTGEKEDFFFRSIEDLQRDIGMGRRQIIEGIQLLEDLKMIETWQMHWVDRRTGKKSEKHITAFKILSV